jgi:hypothetical protein
MIRAYKKHEARIMLASLTRDIGPNLGKVAVVLKNLRFDFHFTLEAIKFILGRLLG